MKTSKAVVFAAVAELGMCGFCAGLDLQRRIDAASSADGIVRIEPGEYWDVKPVKMKSNVELRIESGAVIHASTNYSDYVDMPGWDRGAFIWAIGATNIAITGGGMIECSGDRMPRRGGEFHGRWRGIHFLQCRNVRLEGFSLANTHSWGCYVQECDGVTVRGLTIRNHANLNNDGIDIASSNVLVEDCDIDSEDDAIVFKNHNPDFVVENVTVRRCRLSTNSNYVKIGTESFGGFRNIRVSDCELECRTAASKRSLYVGKFGVTVRKTGSAGLSVLVVDGGFAEDIVYSRIRMKSGVMAPLCIRLDRRRPRKDGKPTYLRNVTIEDVEMSEQTSSYLASSITGADGLRPSDIVLRRIHVKSLACGDGSVLEQAVPENVGVYPGCRMFNVALPAYGFYLRHADRIRFEDVTVEPSGHDVRRAIVADDATFTDAGSAKEP